MREPARVGRHASGAEIGELYDEHVWSVYAFLAYRVNRRADAEDLTQQTFERAVRSWKRFDPNRSSPRTWLLTIARNLAIDHYRRSKGGRDVSFDELEERGERVSVQGPEDNLGLSPELESALGRLSPRDREVIALRFGGDMTGPQIADALRLSLSNVQQILSRSLRKLRAELESVEDVRAGAGSSGERAGAENAERDSA
jgi:RNA polymerase sigma factor (sigma-70 family)